MATSETQLTPQNLAGKVAIVSGSSSGIGAAIARDLSSRGAYVIINYPFPSEKANAQAVLEGLPTRSQSIIAEADLSTLEGPKRLVSAAAEKYGKVDFLINNAGVNNLCNVFQASDDEVCSTWERVVNLNGRGTLMLTRAVLPVLSPAGSRIVNIGSSTSRDPDPDMTLYAGSKGMIESFTRCWARDLPPKHGCTVNTIAPGPVATEGLLAAPPEFLDMLKRDRGNAPAGRRFAKPEEIAHTVAMLCDEKSGWLNGLYIPVAGGAMLS